MLLCHTGLALSSSVAGFGVSLPSVCFLLRVQFVVFFFSLFVVSGLLAGSLCVLLRIRACTCSVNFMLNFVSCLLDSNFIFRFVVVHSSQVYLVWLYDHHLRRVLVASNRPPFVLIRSYIRIQATLLRIAAPANFPTSPSALYRVFDTFPTLFLESGPHLQPHHNGGAAVPSSQHPNRPRILHSRQKFAVQR